MLQDQLLCIFLNILAFYIVDLQMKVITNNFYLRLASNNINPIILNEFMFKNLDKI